LTRGDSEKLHEAIRVLPRFFKAHGHGNDYLVFEQGEGPQLTPLLIRRICHPHRGPGADGLVVVESEQAGSVAMLRMFNPDGREFERSGNGLRIAGVYLTRVGRRGAERFPVEVAGDEVWLEVSGPDGAGVWDVSADMGRVEFPDGPPFLASGRLNDGGTVPLRLSAPDGGDAVVAVMPVSVGNPHAVALREGWSRREVEHYGPLIATAGPQQHSATHPGQSVWPPIPIIRATGTAGPVANATTTNPPRKVYSRLRNAAAPSWMAAAISCMTWLPLSMARTRRVCTRR